MTDAWHSGGAHDRGGPASGNHGLASSGCSPSSAMVSTPHSRRRAGNPAVFRRRSGDTLMRRTILTLLLLLGPAAAWAGGTLRIGLNEDPDALDPARSGCFVGRLVS